MSSISQMERSSSQTRILATSPPGCGNRRRFREQTGLRLARRDLAQPEGARCLCLQAPQFQNESSSLTLPRSRPHLAFMRLHNLVHNGEAQPGTALKVRLEWLEDLFYLLPAHTGSAIGKTKLPVGSQRLDTHSERASAWHGAHRIFAKVPKHLLDLVTIRLHPGFANRKVTFYGDAGVLRGHAVLHQGESVFHQRQQVDFIEVILLTVGVSQEVGNDIVQTLRFAGHNFEEFSVLLAHLRHRRKHTDGSCNRSQWIADFMSNRRRQASYGSQTVLHANFPLQTPDFG